MNADLIEQLTAEVLATQGADTIAEVTKQLSTLAGVIAGFSPNDAWIAQQLLGIAQQLHQVPDNMTKAKA